MKNYYDELEVSRNASPEIINRAYKVLAKKYHPDTTKEDKQEAEERFKKISEAYETLSDEQKRLEYDHTLSPEISVDDYNKLLDDNKRLSSELLNLKAKFDNLNNTPNTSYYNTPNQNVNSNFTQENQNINNQYQPNNQNIYNRVVYNRPTRRYSYFDILKFKINRFFKNIIALILTIALIFVIISILLYIPSTRNYILNDLHFGVFLNFFN